MKSLKRLSLLVFLSFVVTISALLDSGAPDNVCDSEVFPGGHSTDLTFADAFTMKLAPIPVVTCGEITMYSSGTKLPVCIETTLLAEDKECSVVKVDGAEYADLRHGRGCATPVSASSFEKCQDIANGENASDKLCITVKTGAKSRCASLEYKYSYADVPATSAAPQTTQAPTFIDETQKIVLPAECICLDHNKFYVRVAVANPPLSEVCPIGFDPEMVKNNEHFNTPNEKCTQVGTNNICVVSKIMNINEECTKITVGGADFLELSCQLIGNAFAQNPQATSSGVSGITKHAVNLEAARPLDKYADPPSMYRPTAKTCKNLASGDELCVERITDESRGCSYITINGLSVIKSCHCLKYNAWYVRKVFAMKDDECKVKTKADDDIQIQYRAVNTANWWEVDNQWDNMKPVDVELGSVQFMKGWDLGLVDMCVGEVRNLTIPQKHYTDGYLLTYEEGTPHPLIRDEDTLSFEILLVKIVGAKTEL